MWSCYSWNGRGRPRVLHAWLHLFLLDSTENHWPKSLLRTWTKVTPQSLLDTWKIWGRFSRWCRRLSLSLCLWGSCTPSWRCESRPEAKNGGLENRDWTTCQNELANFPCHEMRLHLQRSNWQSFPLLQKHKKTMLPHWSPALPLVTIWENPVFVPKTEDKV